MSTHSLTTVDLKLKELIQSISTMDIDNISTEAEEILFMFENVEIKKDVNPNVLRSIERNLIVLDGFVKGMNAINIKVLKSARNQDLVYSKN